MEQLHCTGDRSQIINFISSFVESNDAIKILEVLNANIDLLSSEEHFEETYDFDSDTSSDLTTFSMSLMIPRTSYYLNLKATTFLTLCLISGVVLSVISDGNPLLKYGLTATSTFGDVCGLFGVSANTHKLNQLQRKIVNSLWRIPNMTESDIVKNIDTAIKKDVRKALSDLLEWGVVKKEGGQYKYVI